MGACSRRRRDLLWVCVSIGAAGWLAAACWPAICALPVAAGVRVRRTRYALAHFETRAPRAVLHQAKFALARVFIRLVHSLGRAAPPNETDPHATSSSTAAEFASRRRLDRSIDRAPRRVRVTCFMSQGQSRSTVFASRRCKAGQSVAGSIASDDNNNNQRIDHQRRAAVVEVAERRRQRASRREVGRVCASALIFVVLVVVAVGQRKATPNGSRKRRRSTTSGREARNK
jgi:hypothetical protein